MKIICSRSGECIERKGKGLSKVIYILGLVAMVALVFCMTDIEAHAAAPNYIGNINSANNWQIVDQGYTGNSHSNKVSPSSKSQTTGQNITNKDVYIQKNVVPTGEENEFLVYLSMDRKVNWKEYLDQSEYVLTTSNKYKNIGLGTIVQGPIKNIAGNKTVVYDSSVGSGGRTYFVRVSVYASRNSSTPMYIYTSTRYGTSPNCSNGTLFMRFKLTDYYVAAQTEVSLGAASGTHNGGTIDVKLYADSINADFSFYSTSFDKVVDELGDRIEFMGFINSDGNAVISNDKKKITWNPSENSGVQAELSRPPITGWYYNVSQLVYKVRLKTEEDGFPSCASNMNSGANDKESCEVNKEAKLTYHRIPLNGGSAEYLDVLYPVPHVRGLLYDIELEKVNSADVNKKLKGAVFGIYDGRGDLVDTKVTDSNGILRFINLPYGKDNGGRYTIKEIKAPLGYKKNTSKKDIVMSYTSNRTAVSVTDPLLPENKIYGTNGSDFVYINKDKVNALRIKNDESVGSISVKKTVKTNDSAVDKDKLYEFKVILKTGKYRYTREDIEVHQLEPELEGTPMFHPNPNGYKLASNKYVGSQTLYFSLNDTGDWEAEIKLLDGEELTISGVPATSDDFEIEYQILENEASAEGFRIESTNDVGIVSENSVSRSEFRNIRYLGDFNLKKIDAEDINKVIGGASFILTKATVDNNDQWMASTDSSDITYHTSDDQGLIQFQGLEPGYYILEEKIAPIGYELSRTQWHITVLSEESNNVIVTSVEDDETIAVPRDSEGQYIFKNEKMSLLPSTGGKGINVIMLTGIMIMLIALTLFWHKKRRDNRDAKYSIKT